MKITGDLTITKENQNDFKDVTEVTGNIDIRPNATADFPALQTSSYIYISENATADFPALQTSSYIYISENATADFPALQTSGNIDIRPNATADFPALQTSGNIDIRPNATADFPALQTSSYIYISENATADFPALQTSGYIDIRPNATLKAPLLVEQFQKIGYVIVDGVFTQGIYLNLSEKEVGYLRTIKPLLASGRVVMSTWHQNENWKTKTIEEVIHNCGTTHCVAGWIQIIEKDKYNDMTAEQCGNTCAPNLAPLFFKSEAEVETIINTLIKD